ncbi:hypothetical protein F5Y17DRAFT_123512 [Xylariaceae sp. FL0594]|nr:hypothetical protein F5Y17DRAFT_123512 [Xylariaceae sp. FL0594]
MNKNWNDRADKDLFFTILSVKNIGVISGAEWTTIGNHMRSLGYGFTNEGCRQHFQGLRRAQHKSESNKSASEGQRKDDPSANPIARRPGPGRGRPRKLATIAVADVGQKASPKISNPPSEAQASDAPSAAGSARPSITGPNPSATSAEKPTSSDTQEQPSKRQRLEDDRETDPNASAIARAEEEVHPVSSDEAVLALAADGIASVVDDYPSEYYDEA